MLSRPIEDEVRRESRIMELPPFLADPVTDADAADRFIGFLLEHQRFLLAASRYRLGVAVPAGHVQAVSLLSRHPRRHALLSLLHTERDGVLEPVRFWRALSRWEAHGLAADAQLGFRFSKGEAQELVRNVRTLDLEGPRVVARLADGAALEILEEIPEQAIPAEYASVFLRPGHPEYDADMEPEYIGYIGDASCLKDLLSQGVTFTCVERLVISSDGRWSATSPEAR